MVVLISLQGRDHGPRMQMDPILPLSFSHDLTNGASEHASQRGRAAFNNGDIQAKITADRGNFTADKAAANKTTVEEPVAADKRSAKSTIEANARREERTVMEVGMKDDSLMWEDHA